MAGIDVKAFIQKAHEYVQNGPSEERKAEDEFTSHFLFCYDLIRRTAGINGFSSELDLSTVSYDDLDWIIGQIEQVPNAEVGMYEGEIDELDYFRDRALKIYESGLISLTSILRCRSVRPVEDYF